RAAHQGQLAVAQTQRARHIRAAFHSSPTPEYPSHGNEAVGVRTGHGPALCTSELLLATYSQRASNPAAADDRDAAAAGDQSSERSVRRVHSANLTVTITTCRPVHCAVIHRLLFDLCSSNPKSVGCAVGGNVIETALIGGGRLLRSRRRVGILIIWIEWLKSVSAIFVEGGRAQSRHTIRHVVMSAGTVVDAILAGTGNPALQSAQLGDQAAIVEQ